MLVICSCPSGSRSDLITLPATALPAGAARAMAAISAGRSGHSATGSGAAPRPPTAGHSRSREARSRGGIVTAQRTARPSARADSRALVVRNATGASPLTAANTAGSSVSASRQITAAPLSRAERARLIAAPRASPSARIAVSRVSSGSPAAAAACAASTVRPAPTGPVISTSTGIGRSPPTASAAPSRIAVRKATSSDSCAAASTGAPSGGVSIRAPWPPAGSWSR